MMLREMFSKEYNFIESTDISTLFVKCFYGVLAYLHLKKVCLVIAQGLQENGEEKS